jgi:hypothetical protein
MKLTIAALTLAAAISAHASPLTFTDTLDPSSQGTGIVIRPGQFYDIQFQSNLNGTEFNGQNVQLDILFNGFFVRAFTQTQKLHDLGVDLFLPYLPFWPGVIPPPNSPDVTGTATLLDALGQPIGSPITLDHFLDGGPTFEPDVQLFFRPDFANTPTDFYGIRYDLQLSDSPGKMFAVAPRQDELALFGFFGVGPGVPRDIVPDAGSTLALLLCGLAACAAFKPACSRFAGRSGYRGGIAFV